MFLAIILFEKRHLQNFIIQGKPEICVGYFSMRNPYTKFQDDISNMNTYIHTDKPKPICPHFFKVGGITRKVPAQGRLRTLVNTDLSFKTVQTLQEKHMPTVSVSVGHSGRKVTASLEVTKSYVRFSISSMSFSISSLSFGPRKLQFDYIFHSRFGR